MICTEEGGGKKDDAKYTVENHGKKIQVEAREGIKENWSIQFWHFKENKNAFYTDSTTACAVADECLLDLVS